MRLLVFLPLAAVLSGCIATAPTHDSKLATSIAAASRGDVDDAIRTLDAQMNTPQAKADLLLNLERGELLRIGSKYADSQTAFELADLKVKAWEETARTAPEKLLDQVGALLGGDGARAYEGQDYEKVMLTTRMAMNRLNLGDLDTARVDIKRTHEREAIIAEFRARETAEARKQAEEKGVKAEFKELNGYPVETLNDPEVLKLKNGFQNALSHYLAGFVYEALNEPGLAAPGYRHAIELRPGVPVLEDGLLGLDKRTGFRRQRAMTDLLFIIEAGNAPARKSHKVGFPVPTPSGLIMVSFAFPVIYPEANPVQIEQVLVGQQKLDAALVTDFNAMARRALQDELPGIQTRAAVRALGKGLIQDQVNRQFGVFGGLVGNLVAAATEGDADDRMWRALPDRMFIARAFVAPGEYEVRLPGYPEAVKKIAVDGRYMVVPVRMYSDKIYFGEPVRLGKLMPIAAPKELPPAKPAERQRRQPVPNSTPKPPTKPAPTRSSI